MFGPERPRVLWLRPGDQPARRTSQLPSPNLLAILQGCQPLAGDKAKPLHGWTLQAVSGIFWRLLNASIGPLLLSSGGPKLSTGRAVPRCG